MALGESARNIATVVTACVALLSAGFYAGHYSSQSEIAALNRDINLLTNARGIEDAFRTIDSVALIASDLFELEKHADQIAKLHQEIDKAKNHIKKLNEENQQFEAALDLEIAKNGSLAEKLEALESALRLEWSLAEVFELSEGNSKLFFNGRQLVGLETVFTSFLVLNSPAGSDRLSAGEKTRWSNEHSTCELSLVEILSEAGTAKFSILCE